MKLYTFFRSSASYRVRIALNIKGLDYQQLPIHLRRGGGEQWTSAYKAINPQGLVPTLEDGGRSFPQSLAIIEYLEELYPEPPLLPGDPAGRATVRGMALTIACEIHPLQNLRVLNYLRNELKHEETDINYWARHWITLGLLALEQMVTEIPKRGKFCFGDAPSMADVVLIPQLYNAQRFSCDLSECPNLVQIEANCGALPAFAKAAPENQPDAE
jgi:maleylpyruvate isomerase